MEKRSGMPGEPDIRQPPVVDLQEAGDNLLVRIELPGVKSADVDVSITDDALIIRHGKTANRPRNLRQERCGEAGIVGGSPRLQACLALARQAAARETSVLIAGEAGTGKELFARFIHQHSRRSGGNFVVIDCTSLPPGLVESLSGSHGQGAGSVPDAAAGSGLLYQARHGTLFLDEVGELPLLLQKAFLRAIHQRQLRGTDSCNEASGDYRLIAATRHNLAQEAVKGLFCQDLLLDINSCVIDLPPLRERTEDLGALTRHFVDSFCRQYQLPAKQMTPEFLLHITHYAWPGNVHELSNVLEQAIFNAQAETTLFPKHLPVNVRVQATKALWYARHAGAPAMTPSRRGNLPKLQDMREGVFSRAEQQYLHNLITLTGRDIEQACELSGLSRSRLYTLLKKHQITAH